MFINEYFKVEQISDNQILIMDKDGIPYEWGKDAVRCCYPEQHCDDGPFLLVKYSDNTWSLCHAEDGPMSGATRIPEKKDNVCPIEFSEDFIGDCEYTVDDHTYDCQKTRGGCFKKALAGFLALGAMLVGVESVFRVCAPVDNEKVVSLKKEEKSSKKQPTENKEEYMDFSKDTCTIIKSATKAFIQDVISGFRTRG